MYYCSDLPGEPLQSFFIASDFNLFAFPRIISLSHITGRILESSLPGLNFFLYNNADIHTQVCIGFATAKPFLGQAVSLFSFFKSSVLAEKFAAVSPLVLIHKNQKFYNC